jgi:hypothetical protein
MPEQTLDYLARGHTASTSARRAIAVVAAIVTAANAPLAAAICWDRGYLAFGIGLYIGPISNLLIGLAALILAPSRLLYGSRAYVLSVVALCTGAAAALFATAWVLLDIPHC